MTWEELKEKHRKEHDEYIDAMKKSLNLLYDDKIDILRSFNFMASKTPGSVQRFLEQKHKEWQGEWGIDGWRGRRLKAAHDKEMKTFFERERIMKDLRKPNEHKKDNDMGR